LTWNHGLNGEVAIFTSATLASAVISCRRVSIRPSVCLSVTNRCSTETAKRRITQTTPHNSQWL